MQYGFKDFCRTCRETGIDGVIIPDLPFKDYIVSLEDLVEEIFGDIEDEHDNTSYISKQIDEREYVLSARLEIEKVNGPLNPTTPIREPVRPNK